MTYPDDPNALGEVGIFQAEGRDADKLRDKIAAIALQWFNQCQSDRTKQERQWYLNYAFYAGNQHVQFRTVQGQGNFDLYTPKAPYYRVRMVVNQIRRIVRKEIARLTAQKPNAFVMPATSEDQDVFAAQASEQIWDSLWRRLNFSKTLREAIFWQAITGIGYLKSYWDPNAQDPGSPDAKGDIAIQSVSPFHIFVPDLLATDIEMQPYVIQAQVKNKSWIKQHYGIDADSAQFDSVDEGINNIMNVSRNDSKRDQAIILEVWVKPNYLPDLPKGGMFTVAGNQIVQGFDFWPYDHGKYPYAKLDGVMTGKYYCASIVEDLLPVQRELNRSRSQLIESKNRMSKPQLMAEKGSVDARRITTEPGQLIEFAVGAQPPQPLPLQNIPSYVTQEIDRLYTDLSDLSGQHEVSNGSTPPGVTAATAISFLQEQDESLIATHFTSIEEAIEKVAAEALYYVQMYWDEPRTVKVAGVDGTFDVQMFKGSDLRGNVDIRIEAGSALPTSRAAKQAFIMDLMKMGFIPPDEGLEMMEVGALNKIYERIQVDKRQAQRENLKMRAVTEEQVEMNKMQWQQAHSELTVDVDAGLQLDPPPVVPVNTWDNHEVHIQVHNDYRKSQYFDSMSPMTKAIFEEHVRMHQEAIAGMMTHPLTGMDPSNPQAPNPEDEEAAMQDQQASDDGTLDSGGSGSPGPQEMPQMSDQMPEGAP